MVGTTYAPVTTKGMGGMVSNPYSSDEESESDPEYNSSSDGENSSSDEELDDYGMGRGSNKSEMRSTGKMPVQETK